MVKFTTKQEQAKKLIPYGVYGNVLVAGSCKAGRDTGMFNLLVYELAGYDPEQVKMCILEYFDKLTGKWHEVKTHGIFKAVNKERNEYEFIHVSSRGRDEDLKFSFEYISEVRLTDSNCRNF